MMKFNIIKQQGVFSLQDIRNYLQLRSDGQYSVEIKSIRQHRSIDQNAYMWGCVYPMLLEALNDSGWEFVNTGQIHEYCKKKFASIDVVNRNSGDIENLPADTKSMDTIQFSSYIDSIRNWAVEYLGMDIPDPTSYYKLIR